MPDPQILFFLPVNLGNFDLHYTTVGALRYLSKLDNFDVLCMPVRNASGGIIEQVSKLLSVSTFNVNIQAFKELYIKKPDSCPSTIC